VNAQQAQVFEQNAVTAAKRSVELSLVQYREGAADYQRVLDAQRSLLQEQNTWRSRARRRDEPGRALQGAGRRLGAA
jgi:outer membrane protein TolC